MLFKQVILLKILVRVKDLLDCSLKRLDLR